MAILSKSKTISGGVALFVDRADLERFMGWSPDVYEKMPSNKIKRYKMYMNLRRQNG